uniref:Uncharacterized protein n=1 Tax=Anguilla anguilla TaxID=7936 RepID=A0A0E9X9A9_ANGAN
MGGVVNQYSIECQCLTNTRSDHLYNMTHAHTRSTQSTILVLGMEWNKILMCPPALLV